MQKEIWKDIPNYEGKYQVSNLGRVKSLSRIMFNSYGSFISKERILKNIKDKYGYVIVNLCKNNKQKTFKIHQLVSIIFLNHKPNGHNLVVDHINNDKLDNRLENLQIITHRENICKDRIGTSKYPGVSYCKISKKWRARIQINKISYFLGYFTNEKDATIVYENRYLKYKLEENDKKAKR